MRKTTLWVLAACFAFAANGTTACDDLPAPPVQRSAGTPKAIHFVSGMATFTFDDGWIGQADFGAPRLESRGWRGTFYLVPQWFGKKRDREAFMTLEQARA